MLGGVGRAVRDGGPYPIRHAFLLSRHGARARHRSCYHEGHEEHEGNQSTKRLMPSFSFVTLKFISNPILTSANFI